MKASGPLAGYRVIELGQLLAGTLAIFDQRDGAPPLPDRCSRSETTSGGRRVTVLRL